LWKPSYLERTPDWDRLHHLEIAITLKSICCCQLKSNGHYQKCFNRKYQILSISVINHSAITTSQEILTQSVDFTSLDAFRCIDYPYMGYITIDSLQSFLRSNGAKLTYDEL
jgi:hypothetical protein